jgi:glycosyltransferase involved in cell wall biosynthesis
MDFKGGFWMNKVVVRGPGLTRTGYGEHTRFVLRSLRKIEDQIDIYFVPVPWGQSSWVWEDNEERAWMDQIIKKTALYNQSKGQYDISLQVTIPNEWQRMAPVNIGVTAGIETTKVAPVWLEKANGMDHIITVSNHSKDVFENTSYQGVNNQTSQKMELQYSNEMEVIHYPIKEHKTVDLDLDLETDFNFLTVAQWGPRKNIYNTISWFVEEFIDNPDVGLVVKTFMRGGSVIDKEAVSQQLANLLKKYPNRKCKVYLLHGDMTEEEMHALYKHKKIKAFVSLSHGEGFGLPHFEASYSGLPVVAPEWSGYLDFLCMPKKDKKGREKMKPHFATVEYQLQPVQKEAVWEGVLQADSMWAYAQQGSYKMRLREVFKDHGRFISQAKKLQKYNLKNFEVEKQYDKFCNAVQQFLPSEEDMEWEKDLSKIKLI